MPAFRNRSRYCESSYWLRIRIFVSLCFCRISRVASRPPSFGIAISMRTTSGFNLPVISMASRPISASPITSIPPCVSIIARIPSRTRAWSSAMSTVILCMGLQGAYRNDFVHGEVDMDGSSFTRIGLYRKSSSEVFDPLPHAEQSKTLHAVILVGLECLVYVESYAGVGDIKVDGGSHVDPC